MEHPVHRVKAFEIVGPYRLHIEFGDGLVRTIDFRPVLEGELSWSYCRGRYQVFNLAEDRRACLRLPSSPAQTLLDFNLQH